MNLLLDPKTFLISLGIGHLFTLILISVYWRGFTRDMTIKAFLLSKCAQAATWLFQAFRGDEPGFLSLSFPNSMLFIGASLEVIALLSLQNKLRPRTPRIYFILTAAAILGFQLILLLNNKESVRVAYVSFVTALLILPLYRMILGKSVTLLMRMMGYLYLFVIAVSLSRGAAAVFSQHGWGTYSPAFYQSMVSLSLYIVMILGNAGFVLLLKEKSDQELIRLASYDGLTGTFNRITFTSKAKQALQECAKKRKPVSYMLFDIDFFKAINDTYGHTVGDQVLQDLTARIQRLLSDSDLLVRYGGDEFGILLPGADEAESTLIAEQIRQALLDANTRGLPVKYSISMGVLTVAPDEHTQLETLYAACDKALYSAKNSGRNHVYRSQADLQAAFL
ncbi:GGDEF domain-containing protein [Paenibacillus cremeus]|nr:diguanylate cyclase [Paenibacillus cremeus]